MNKRFLDAAKSTSPYYLLYATILTFIIYNFVIFTRGEQAGLLFNNYLKSACLIFFSIALIFSILIFLSLSFNKDEHVSLVYSGIVLFPIVLLYFFRPLKPQDFPLLIPLVLVLAIQISFFEILSKDGPAFKIGAHQEKLIILLLIALYFIFFGFIGVEHLDTFSFFNAKDFAIYNQTFWNTIHGRLFQNSAYGSNFACHNTLFFWILIPFYYLRPDPTTLLFLKILLLALSVIPFCLIAKSVSRDIPLIPASLAFMFYPYLVSQSLNPPHEITYAPFFLLFTYYFFKTSEFRPFLIFLLVSISIKEHLALLAIMFGVLAAFNKKSIKWILAPISLGIAWSFLSLLIINHFQKIYMPNPDAAWFLSYFKRGSLAYFASYSNAIHWHTIRFLFPMFSSLGVIFPFLNPAIILGLPELFINLLADRTAMLSAAWHYNITASCFLLIATLEGVKKASDSRWIKRFKVNDSQTIALLSVFILSCVLMHAYLWLGLVRYPKNYTCAKSVEEAISIVPPNAFVTVPRNIAIRVSAREKYSLLEENKPGDYILIDTKHEPLLSAETLKDYTCLLDKDGIKLFKK